MSDLRPITGRVSQVPDVSYLPAGTGQPGLGSRSQKGQLVDAGRAAQGQGHRWVARRRVDEDAEDVE